MIYCDIDLSDSAALESMLLTITTNHFTAYAKLGNPAICSTIKHFPPHRFLLETSGLSVNPPIHLHYGDI